MRLLIETLVSVASLPRKISTAAVLSGECCQPCPFFEHVLDIPTCNDSPLLFSDLSTLFLSLILPRLNPSGITRSLILLPRPTQPCALWLDSNPRRFEARKSHKMDSSPSLVVESPLSEVLTLPTRRRRIGRQIWEEQRATIEQLYVDQDRSLQETMKIMEDVHGFQAT